MVEFKVYGETPSKQITKAFLKLEDTFDSVRLYIVDENSNDLIGSEVFVFSKTDKDFFRTTLNEQEINNAEELGIQIDRKESKIRLWGEEDDYDG